MPTRKGPWSSVVHSFPKLISTQTPPLCLAATCQNPSRQMGVGAERSYVRLADTRGFSNVRDCLPADWTDRLHCTRTDLFSVLPPRSLLSSPCLYDLYLPLHTLPHIFRPSMAPNVTAAAAHIAYDMQPPESLHRTKYQIKAKKNQDLEHTELEMLITMNVHIPLPNPNPNPSQPFRDTI